MDNFLKPITKHYIICPLCEATEDGPGYIDHLLNINTTFGTWYCAKCGQGVKGEIKDGKLINLRKEGWKKKTLSLLRFRGKLDQDKPVFIIINDVDYEWSSKDPKEKWDNKRFYLEENTCLTNFIRNIEDIIENNDDDPHGLFEYISTIDYIENWEQLSVVEKAKAFGYEYSVSDPKFVGEIQERKELSCKPKPKPGMSYQDKTTRRMELSDKINKQTIKLIPKEENFIPGDDVISFESKDKVYILNDDGLKKEFKKDWKLIKQALIIWAESIAERNIEGLSDEDKNSLYDPITAIAWKKILDIHGEKNTKKIIKQIYRQHFLLFL